MTNRWIHSDSGRHENRFNALLEQYVTDAISKEDLITFYALLKDPHYQGLWNAALEKEWDLGVYEEPEEEKIGKAISEGVLTAITMPKLVPVQRSPVFTLRKAAIAAVVITVLGASLYWMRTGWKKDKEATGVTAVLASDVQPGGNKAVLILGDGKQIDLANLSDGTVADQGDTRITKRKDGMIVYEVSGNAVQVYHNSIRTPKGGQYQVQLADGTGVWLNSASSIQFPAAFTGRERRVEITGEVYFEVAHQREKPFIVVAKNMELQVLGTHFTVNAYNNEPAVKATLLQGKIKIDAARKMVVLSPGEQAAISGDALSVIKQADTAEAVCWKNGYFKFNQADVKTVMRQMERWYDLEVRYDRDSQNDHFNGVIPRNIPASNLIRILNAGGISCTLEENTIVVR